MDIATRKKRMSKIQKEMKASLDYWERDKFWDEATKLLETWLRDPQPRGGNRVATRCEIYASQYLTQSCYDLLFEGKTLNAHDLYLGYRCIIDAWHAGLVFPVAPERRYTFATCDFSLLSHAFGLAVIFGEPDVIRELSDALYRYQTNNVFYDVSADLPFLAFMHRMANRYIGQDIEMVHPNRYDKAVEVIDRPEELTKQVEAILDHQLDAVVASKLIDEEHRQFYGEALYMSAYVYPPTMALPTAVLLINKLCLMEGHTFPVIDHPLYPPAWQSLITGEVDKTLPPLLADVFAKVTELRHAADRGEIA